MPDDKNLFVLTQWILRAALSLNAAIIVIMIVVTGAIALRVDTLMISPAQFTQFTQNASGELTRDVAKDLNTKFDLSLSAEQLSDAAQKIVARVTRDDVAKIVMTFLAGAAVVAVLVLLILRVLLNVVTSASVGDPFVATNAARIAQVAWLLLGIYVVQYGAGHAVYAAIPASLKDFPIFHGGHSEGIPATGLFTVLLIFVLARIFRHGTEMRAELEGTV